MSYVEKSGISCSSAMGLVHISSWYPKSDGSHFGLPHSSSLHAGNDWTGWQKNVNNDVFAQASFPFRILLRSFSSKTHLAAFSTARARCVCKS